MFYRSSVIRLILKSLFIWFFISISNTGLFALEPIDFRPGESVLVFGGENDSSPVRLKIDTRNAGEIRPGKVLLFHLKPGRHLLEISGPGGIRKVLELAPNRILLLSFYPGIGFQELDPARLLSLDAPQITGLPPVPELPAAAKNALEDPAILQRIRSYDRDEYEKLVSSLKSIDGATHIIGLKYGMYGFSWSDATFQGSGRFYKPLEPGWGVIYFTPPDPIAPGLGYSYEIDASHDRFTHLQKLPLERNTIQAGVKILAGDLQEGHPGIYAGLTVGYSVHQIRGYSPMIFSDSDRMIADASRFHLLPESSYDSLVLWQNYRDTRTNPAVLLYYAGKQGTPAFDQFLQMDLMQNGFYREGLPLLGLYGQILSGQHPVNSDFHSLHANFLSEGRFREIHGFQHGPYLAGEFSVALYGVYLSFKPTIYFLNPGEEGGSIIMDQGAMEFGLYLKI